MSLAHGCCHRAQVSERLPDQRMKNDARFIRVFVASDHAMFREALRILLEQEGDLCVVGEASDDRSVLNQLGRLKPDILLLDLALPHVSGIQVLRALGKDASPMRSIVFDDSADRGQIIEALRHGAHGVVSKHSTPQLLAKSIRTVAAGEYWVGHGRISDLIDILRSTALPAPKTPSRNGFHLTARELDVVAAIVEGYTNREIAQKFSISEQTVKHHLTSIFEKVGVSNRLELALLAVHQPWAA